MWQRKGDVRLEAVVANFQPREEADLRGSWNPDRILSGALPLHVTPSNRTQFVPDE